MARGKVGAGVQKLKGIKCKAKRIEVFQKLKKEGDTQNRKDRKKRQKDTEALGDDAPDLKLQQKTLDNTREVDETIVGPDDPDIAAEDSFDEFSGHFLQQLQPRTIVTTSMNPSKFIEEFLAEMVEMLPNSEYRKRSKCGVKDMCDAAVKRGATARSNKRPRELAVPELGSCASSRRARQLWAARCSLEEGLGRWAPNPLPRVLASRLPSRRFHRPFLWPPRLHKPSHLHRGQHEEECGAPEPLGLRAHSHQPAIPAPVSLRPHARNPATVYPRTLAAPAHTARNPAARR